MAKIKDYKSGLIHCVAAGLSLAGLVILIIFAAINGDAFDIVSFTLFGTGLLLYYTFSTLYHWLNLGKNGTNIFKKFDNIMTYLLIAVTFTPICLGPIRGAWGWSIFGIIWGFSVAGISLSAIWVKLPKLVIDIFYIILGIIIFITIFPLINTYKVANLLNSLYFLLIGSIFYFLGGFINNLKFNKSSIKQINFHDVLHIFTVIGSIFHYWFIINYITIL